ncbi:MAG: phosphotriesterase family protein [Desulfomonilaceae bacterium]
MDNVRINTVTGPISPEDLGITLVHEHMFFGYPGWEGDQTIAPFDRKTIVDNAVSTLKHLKSFGLRTVIDATPSDTGRNVETLREIAEKSAVNIICSTGYYHEGEGACAYWKFRASLGDVKGEIYELFMKEISDGVMRTGIRAGVIKVGSSKGKITDYENLMFTAAAMAHKESGVPIITHTQDGTMGPQQAELLIGLGADPKRIQIGHMSDNVDLDYHKATLQHGVFTAWDRMGLQGLAGCPMDEARYTAIAELVKQGYTKQLLFSHDAVLTWLGRPLNIPEAAFPLIANWHPGHLFQNIIPALQERGISDEQLKIIIEENPRRLFTGK